jgi:heme/copper-type cytochrome/quinol oxidase subunit 3
MPKCLFHIYLYASIFLFGQSVKPFFHKPAEKPEQSTKGVDLSRADPFPLPFLKSMIITFSGLTLKMGALGRLVKY